MSQLHIHIGGEHIEVPVAERSMVGRSPECDIYLDDSFVSRVHATITLRDGQYFLEDAGSSRGTTLNGRKLGAAAELRDGDEIQFGRISCVFVAPDVLSQVVSEEVSQEIQTSVLAVADEHFQPASLLDATTLSRDYEKLRVSYELGRSVGGGLDVDELLQRLLRRLLNLLNADHGVVLLTGSDKKLALRCRVAAAGVADSVKVSRTIVEEALGNKRAVLSHDAQVDERFKGAASVMAHGIRSSLAVPLIHQDQVLGILALDSRVHAHVFDERDLNIAQTAANQVALAIQNTTISARLAEEALQRQRFQRLVAPNIAESIVDGALVVDKVGEMREVSVLFSDIRGFTSYSEMREPAEIVDMLNEYFEAMVDIVFAHGGTLDKFVGDEIMVVFGAPVGQSDHAARAAQTAVDMQRHTQELREQWAGEGESPLRVGIGINSGGVIAGFLGSSKALDYTVIGDVVNTAARLCSAAASNEILVGDATMALLENRFISQAAPPLTVKGKAQPLVAHHILID